MPRGSFCVNHVPILVNLNFDCNLALNLCRPCERRVLRRRQLIYFENRLVTPTRSSNQDNKYEAEQHNWTPS